MCQSAVPAAAHPSDCRRTQLTDVIDGAIAAAEEEEGAGCIVTGDRLDLLDLGQERGTGEGPAWHPCRALKVPTSVCPAWPGCLGLSLSPLALPVATHDYL